MQKTGRIKIAIKTIVILGAVLAITALIAPVSFAQSSGNFTYGSNSGTVHCVLNNNGTGTISGGATCNQAAGPSCTGTGDCALGSTCFNPTGATAAGQCVDSTTGASCTSNAQCTTGTTCVIPNGTTTGVCGVITPQGGKCAGGFSVGIKTNSGSGNVFLIRPSAVVGLLTNVSVSKSSTISIGTSSALAGVDFNVIVTPQNGQPQPTIVPAFPITYASRFVQISTNLFDVLGTLCTDTSGGVGGNQLGGTTTALGCFISFNESTVSAHSFDWIATGLASGNYNVAVNWSSAMGNFGLSNSMTCVGPVNLTVQQNKVFSFNTTNSF